MDGCDSFGQDCGADMTEDSDGDYVLFDDVVKLFEFDTFESPARETPVNKIDYQALREKAEKATCGVWSLEYVDGRFDGDDALIHREAAGYIPICRIEGAHPESGFDEDFQIEQQANAEFIAAANPATVLALLDERERNQQYIKRRDQENEDIALTVGKLRVELEAAEKRIAELESLTVPQLPQQAVPDGMPEPDTARMFFTDAVVAIAKVQGWNACRAAMLHSAEPVSNHEELPLDYLQGQKDGLEWAAQLAEANHPQTGDWLYDDPLELAKAIRKGPDMPEFDGPTPVTPEAIENAIEYIRSIAFHIDEDDYHGKHIAYFMRQALVWLEGHSCSDDRQGKAENQPVRGNQAAESNRGNEWTGNPDIDNAIIILDRIDTLESCDDDRIEAVKTVLRRLAGNYPVTPDGWISCSERMPAQDDWILIYSKHGEYMAGQVQGEYVELSDGTLSWLGNALYWMLLPEPPQGVNDELA